MPDPTSIDVLENSDLLLAGLALYRFSEITDPVIGLNVVSDALTGDEFKVQIITRNFFAGPLILSENDLLSPLNELIMLDAANVDHTCILGS